MTGTVNLKLVVWSLATVAVYVILVATLGFEGFVAITINFWRVALATAVLIIYLPTLKLAFNEIPPPRRDYLLAGIVLTWMSAICFAVSNEAGRIFGYTTSVYINPVAGAFSLMLVLGGLFHLLAPGTASPAKTSFAVLVGVAVGALVVFVAPLFR